MDKLQVAVAEYLSRKNRVTHPIGKFDAARRWYPASGEHCACCDGLRAPSRAFPYSLMAHCRTAAHIAEKYQVAASDIKRSAKAIS